MCLYISNNVNEAWSLTVTLGSPSKATTAGVTFFNCKSWLPCLNCVRWKKINFNTNLYESIVQSLIESTHSFNTFNKQRSASSRIFAFLWRKAVPSLWIRDEAEMEPLDHIAERAVRAAARTPSFESPNLHKKYTLIAISHCIQHGDKITGFVIHVDILVVSVI